MSDVSVIGHLMRKNYQRDGDVLHELKSWPEYFLPILAGSKQFDLRVNDRRFKVGDLILFREWDDKAGKFTGLEIGRRITYLDEGVGSGGIAPLRGLMRGYVIIGLGSPALLESGDGAGEAEPSATPAGVRKQGRRKTGSLTAR